MVEQWLSTSWGEVALVILSTVVIFGAVIAYVRLVGLRSFSKMSSFDFAMTIAVGSVMASVAASPSVTLANGIVALGALFATQFVIARVRTKASVEHLVDNTPMLLLSDGEFLDDNLGRVRVTRHDVFAKLREHNVLDRASVRAVVLETTGDMSVLHGDDPLDPEILTGVADARRA